MMKFLRKILRITKKFKGYSSSLDVSIRKNTSFKSYQEYLNSPKWKNKRLALFRKRGKRCEKCGSYRGIQVHHITYQRIGNEELSDLQILCSSCHKKTHGIA